jgi:hypothetical protein
LSLAWASISGCWRRLNAVAGMQGIFYIPFTALGFNEGF